MGCGNSKLIEYNIDNKLETNKINKNLLTPPSLFDNNKKLYMQELDKKNNIIKKTVYLYENSLFECKSESDILNIVGKLIDNFKSIEPKLKSELKNLCYYQLAFNYLKKYTFKNYCINLDILNNMFNDFDNYSDLINQINIILLNNFNSNLNNFVLFGNYVYSNSNDIHLDSNFISNILNNILLILTYHSDYNKLDSIILVLDKYILLNNEIINNISSLININKNIINLGIIISNDCLFNKKNKSNNIFNINVEETNNCNLNCLTNIFNQISFKYNIINLGCIILNKLDTNIFIISDTLKLLIINMFKYLNNIKSIVLFNFELLSDRKLFIKSIKDKKYLTYILFQDSDYYNCNNTDNINDIINLKNENDNTYNNLDINFYFVNLIKEFTQIDTLKCIVLGYTKDNLIDNKNNNNKELKAIYDLNLIIDRIKDYNIKIFINCFKKEKLFI